MVSTRPPADLEKLRLALEEDPSERNIERFSNAQERFEIDGGLRRRVRGPPARRRSRAALRPARPHPRRPVGRRAPPPRAGPHPVRRAATCCCSTSPPTTSTPTPATGCSSSCASTGARCSSSPTTSTCSTRPSPACIHLDREQEEAAGEIVEYKGTYSKYLTARDRDEERLAKVAARQASEIARLTTLADSMRGQTAKRARVAKSLDSRGRADARPTRSRARRARRTLAPAVPRAAAVRAHGHHRHRGVEGLRHARRVLRRQLRRRSRRASPHHGAQRRRQDHPAEDPRRPHSSADLGEVELGHKRVGGLLRPGARGHRRGQGPARPHARGVRRWATRPTGPCSGCSGSAATRSFQDADSLSGGEKTKLALAQLVAGQHNLLLLDEPTNNLDPMSRTATGEALASWPGTMIIVSHDNEFVQALAARPGAAHARGPARLLQRRDARPRRARLTSSRSCRPGPWDGAASRKHRRGAVGSR